MEQAQGGPVPILRLVLDVTPGAFQEVTLFFAAGARRIPFATLGILQYVGPSLQLLIGVRLYGEPFGADKLFAYGAIWVALAIFSIDGLWQWRSSKANQP